MTTEDKVDGEPSQSTEPSDPPASESDASESDTLFAEATHLSAAASDDALAEGGEGGAGKRTVGLERWVQLGFMAAGILLVWLYDHLINGIWYFFADPNESVVTAAAVVAGLVTAVILYKTAPVYGIVHGVSEELSKVTWPTRKETSSSTIVVIVTSIVAGLVLFLFDSVWAAVTDLVYKV
jgi:preprotein translocase subunit SecE